MTSSVFKFNVQNINNLKIISKYDKKHTSFVWKYFGDLYYFSSSNNEHKHIETDKVFCKECLQEIKNKLDLPPGEADAEPENIDFVVKSYSKSSSTGNMQRHLFDIHNITEKTSNVKKKKLDEFFKSTSKRKQTTTMSTSDKSFHLNRDIALWYCRDLMPFSKVQGEGFKDFSVKYKIVESENELPHPTTLSRTALDDLYNYVKEEVRKILNIECVHGSIIFDTWTDNYKRRAYIAFVYVFITKNYEFRKATLRTHVVNGRHTGEALSDALDAAINDFGIMSKCTVAVTDRGSNVLKATRLSGLVSHGCWAHSLHNLIMRDGIDDVSDWRDLLKKIRKTISDLRYKIANLEKMDQEDKGVMEIVTLLQEADEFDEIIELEMMDYDSDNSDEFNVIPQTRQSETTRKKTLKMDCRTRWNSLYEMISCFLEQRPCLIKLFNVLKTTDPFSNFDWRSIAVLKDYLKVFKDVTKMLSHDTIPTINMALLFREELKSKLEVSGSEPKSLQVLKHHMMANFEKRFPVSNLVMLSALLDPRFKALRSIPEYIQTFKPTQTTTSCSTSGYSITDFLIESLREFNIEFKTTESTSTVQEISTTSAHQNSLIATLAAKHSSSKIDSDANIRDEIESYPNYKLPAGSKYHVDDSNILEFWHEMKYSYPKLSDLAVRVLCVPATSTSAERNFSTSGNIISAKRSQISPFVAGKVLFVNTNYNLLSLK